MVESDYYGGRMRNGGNPSSGPSGQHYGRQEGGHAYYGNGGRDRGHGQGPGGPPPSRRGPGGPLDNNNRGGGGDQHRGDRDHPHGGMYGGPPPGAGPGPGPGHGHYRDGPPNGWPRGPGPGSGPHGPQHRDRDRDRDRDHYDYPPPGPHHQHPHYNNMPMHRSGPPGQTAKQPNINGPPQSQLHSHHHHQQQQQHYQHPPQPSKPLTHFQKCIPQTRTIAHYKRIEQIGEGTYGQVYKARCLASHQIVALKKIRLTSAASVTEGLPRTVIREIKILKALKHDNMVRMIEVVSSKGCEYLDEEDEHKEDKRRRLNEEKAAKAAAVSGTENVTETALTTSNNKKSANNDNDDSTSREYEKYKGNLFLVLEYISHDLSGILDMGVRFTPLQSKCIFRQLLSVLKYMHENRYVHRDLKSSNILIDDKFHVKLADFGLARCMDDGFDWETDSKEGKGPKYTNKVVTLWYRSPELLLGATNYDEKVDIWSAGCILAELLIGKALFPGTSDVEQLRLIFKMMGTPTERTWEGLKKFPKIRSKEMDLGKPVKGELRDKYGTDDRIASSALSLIERLLELDPKKRWRSARALDSAYFVSKPIAPMNPEELGTIPIQGDSHEFQTKPIRKQAKVIAQKASSIAKKEGKNEKEQKEAYENAYNDFLRKSPGTRDAIIGETKDNKDKDRDRDKDRVDESSSKRDRDGSKDKDRKRRRRDDSREKRDRDRDRDRDRREKEDDSDRERRRSRSRHDKEGKREHRERESSSERRERKDKERGRSKRESSSEIRERKEKERDRSKRDRDRDRDRDRENRDDKKKHDSESMDRDSNRENGKEANNDGTISDRGEDIQDSQRHISEGRKGQSESRSHSRSRDRDRDDKRSRRDSRERSRDGKDRRDRDKSRDRKDRDRKDKDRSRHKSRRDRDHDERRSRDRDRDRKDRGSDDRRDRDKRERRRSRDRGRSGSRERRRRDDGNYDRNGRDQDQYNRDRGRERDQRYYDGGMGRGDMGGYRGPPRERFRDGPPYAGGPPPGWHPNEPRFWDDRQYRR